ncbi:MAG: hypothetical protein HYZ53_04240 [Planctomycetes bacterium]|nr:hypothetical protein [Planctomycetota bacterium]
MRAHIGRSTTIGDGARERIGRIQHARHGARPDIGRSTNVGDGARVLNDGGSYTAIGALIEG